MVYQQLHDTGALKTRAEKAQSILEECCLCSNHCGVNPLAGESGKRHIIN
ncbi:hypothetical protein ACFLV9_00590 [Chloroflexota bacterium]